MVAGVRAVTWEGRVNEVRAGAARRGDGEHQPLVERDAGPGQQRFPEGALGLADDLCVNRRVAGHANTSISNNTPDPGGMGGTLDPVTLGPLIRMTGLR